MMPMNGNNTIFYAAELMVYFEKHKLLKIVAKLLAEIGYERPVCAKKWICENIHRIANEICTSTVCVQLPKDSYDIEKFTEAMWEQCRTPTLTYTRTDPCENLPSILGKVEKFMKKKGLDRKTKILVNFQNNIKEVINLQVTDIKPTSAFLIEKPCPNDGRILFPTFLKHYSDLVQKIKPELDKLTNKPNYDNLVDQIFLHLRHTIPRDAATKLCGAFNYRVVIFGRRGSGRKKQAAALAMRFNLVYIDVMRLIHETLRSNDTMSNVLRVAFKQPSPEITSTALLALIWKRLLQPDALRSGWVLTNGFPNTAEEFRFMMERFTVPPNKIIFLHCSECKATERLIREWRRCPTGLPCDTVDYLGKEMKYFRLHKLNILNYLKTRSEIIHIDGSHSFEKVRTTLWALVEKQQNKYGCIREESEESVTCQTSGMTKKI